MTQQQREAMGEGRKQFGDEELVKMFREKLASRGARGILGMKRVFKIMDDNNNGTLEIQEFWKAI
jgi:hypothetical protein